MRIRDIEEGMRLYDERNGRTITVLKVYHGSQTAYCETVEEDVDPDTCMTLGDIVDTQIFKLGELLHFKEIMAW